MNTYNLRVKKFGNGTLQVCYFSHPMQKPYESEVLPSSVRTGMLVRAPDSVYPDGWMDIDTDLDPFEAAALFFKDEDEELPEKEVDRERSLQVSFNRTKKMIYDYGRSNKWEWFFTLTFDEDKVDDRSDYELCSAKVRKWFNHIRERKCPDIKYLLIPEQHKKGGWHFHALVSNCKELRFEIARNNQRYMKDENGHNLLNEKGYPVRNKYFGKELRTKYPDGNYIYNVGNWAFGFSTATAITDTRKAVSYVVKYITKDLCDLTYGKRRYFASHNLNLPNIYTGTCETPDMLQMCLLYIEYKFGVKLSSDVTKSYTIDTDSYTNTVTVFEFADDAEGIPATLTAADLEKFEKYRENKRLLNLN